MKEDTENDVEVQYKKQKTMINEFRSTVSVSMFDDVVHCCDWKMLVNEFLEAIVERYASYGSVIFVLGPSY